MLLQLFSCAIFLHYALTKCQEEALCSILQCLLLLFCFLCLFLFVFGGRELHCRQAHKSKQQLCNGVYSLLQTVTVDSIYLMNTLEVIIKVNSLSLVNDFFICFS